MTEFHTILARKMPEFYVTIGRKIFFSDFLGGHMPRSPESYVYDDKS